MIVLIKLFRSRSYISNIISDSIEDYYIRSYVLTSNCCKYKQLLGWPFGSARSYVILLSVVLRFTKGSILNF